MFHSKRAADAWWWMAAALMTSLTIATIAGNAGVVSALWRARRSPQHYPLASLAAADLLVGVSVLPLAAANELFAFRLSWIVCACWNTLDVLCCTASILSLCALGWERWSGITEPLARAKRAKWAKLLAVIVWPVATVVALPTAFVKSNEVTGVTCSVNTNPKYVFFSVTFSFYLPTCVMLVQYGQILRALSARPPIRAHRGQAPRTVQKELKTCQPHSSQPADLTMETNAEPFNHLETAEAAPGSMKETSMDDASTRQRQATLTIIRLMSLFLLCWTPFFIMLPIDSLCGCAHYHVQWSTWLGYVNSALNPVVYAAAATRVRRAFRAVFRISALERGALTAGARYSIAPFAKSTHGSGTDCGNSMLSSCLIAEPTYGNGTE